MNPNITTIHRSHNLQWYQDGMSIPALPTSHGHSSTLQLPPDIQSRLNPVQLELLNKPHLENEIVCRIHVYVGRAK
ncbi:CFC_HP_G0068180.mRNA.1.CDS.1 [Saccharomyces cerevisiae]|nr:CFC_HP_G0068180.mRNA.1.CDS.1 [Saccharomyces cerevisiae]CAI6647182.1 CFC_HP_G0068180.mRNA.1.CDS.1 [Saccharomyces cerevisiae]